MALYGRFYCRQCLEWKSLDCKCSLVQNDNFSRLPAQKCLHDVMRKVRFYACSLATWSHYSKFAVLYLLIYVCNIILDIFVCSFNLKFAGLRSLSPQLIMLDRKGGRSRKLFFNLCITNFRHWLDRLIDRRMQ